MHIFHCGPYPNIVIQSEASNVKIYRLVYKNLSQ